MIGRSINIFWIPVYCGNWWFQVENASRYLLVADWMEQTCQKQCESILYERVKLCPYPNLVEVPGNGGLEGSINFLTSTINIFWIGSCWSFTSQWLFREKKIFRIKVRQFFNIIVYNSSTWERQSKEIMKVWGQPKMCLFCFFKSGSLSPCSLRCHGTYPIDHIIFELRDPAASVSWMLEL